MATDKAQFDGLIDSEDIARLAHLPIFARRPMQGNISGRHQSPFRGSSLEFAEYRKYVPGDDTRRLDWRAYGRSDRFYIKEFEADTNLRCYLVVDGSGSMGFGSESNMSKFQYASRLAATLAFLAIKQGDAAAVWILNQGKAIEIPPKRNPAQIKLITEKLSQTVPGGAPPIYDLLHELAEKEPQRGLVIIFSDMYFDPSPLREAMDHLRFAKHDVCLFQISDDRELSFEFDRPMRFIDMESGPDMMTDPQVIRNEYLHALNEHQTHVRKILSETLVDHFAVATSQSIGALLSHFLNARAPKKS